MEQNTNMNQETENTNRRVAIYLDLNNLQKAAEEYNQYGLRLNYRTLVNEIGSDCEIVKLTAYDSTESEDGCLGEIHDCLKNDGFDLQLKKPQINAPGSEKRYTQKEVDTSIVADCIIDAYHDLYDICVIVSGDRDFCPAVDAVRREFGKEVKAYAFEAAMSPCLRNSCNEYVMIEDTMSLELVPEGDFTTVNYARDIDATCGGE